MSQESRTGWHTGAGLHPPTLAASSDPSPTLTTDGEAVQSCPAVYGGGSGGGNAIRSADPDWRMLPPPPPRGDVFIASFTALHKRQINNLEVSVYSPFTPPPWYTEYQKLSLEWGAGSLWIQTQAWAPHTQSRSSGRYCVKSKMAPLSGECLLHPKRQDSAPLGFQSPQNRYVILQNWKATSKPQKRRCSGINGLTVAAARSPVPHSAVAMETGSRQVVWQEASVNLDFLLICFLAIS